MTHHCHAIGCKTPCAPQKLMCSFHWSLVDDRLQLEVYGAYRPGQCDDKRPSAAWWRAAANAVADAHSKVLLIQDRKSTPSEKQELANWERRAAFFKRIEAHEAQDRDPPVIGKGIW
jgi:hypothetical protein